MCQVTVKTLRHYAEIGILRPHEVDEWTRYRYYDVSQLTDMVEILRLKRLGFSLEEIHNMQLDGIKTLTEEMIEEKLRQCEQEFIAIQRRRCELMTLLNSRKTLTDMENITIQSLPAIKVASHRETVKSVQDFFTLIPNVIGEEMHRLGCTCPEPGYCYTIHHDSEHKTSDLDVEYCEQVDKLLADSEIIQFKEVAAVAKAIVYKHHGAYDRFHESWAKLLTYMEENGYEIDGEARFSYIDGIWNKENTEEWLTEIQVPIK